MQRKRAELVPIGEVVSGLDDVPAIRDVSPQARHHFTVADQVNQLVSASEADPDRGFMGRTMALCSLPRTNPGNSLQYERRNGPFTLYMTAGGGNKLPFGNLPRLLLAWLCTEAVRTGSRVLILGSSLSDFMDKLGMAPVGGARTRLRNQMDRLFNAHVSLIYADENGRVTVNSLIADSTAFWWNPQRPNQPSLWESKIELSEKFFNEIIRHPVPLDMNTLKALKRSPLGLDLYLWLVYRTFALPLPATAHLEAVVPPVRSAPGQSQRQQHRSSLPLQGSPRVEENQVGLEGLELLDGSGRPDPLPFNAAHFPEAPGEKGRMNYFLWGFGVFLGMLAQARSSQSLRSCTSSSEDRLSRLRTLN